MEIMFEHDQLKQRFHDLLKTLSSSSSHSITEEETSLLTRVMTANGDKPATLSVSIGTDRFTLTRDTKRRIYVRRDGQPAKRVL